MSVREMVNKGRRETAVARRESAFNPSVKLVFQ